MFFLLPIDSSCNLSIYFYLFFFCSWLFIVITIMDKIDSTFNYSIDILQYIINSCYIVHYPLFRLRTVVWGRITTLNHIDGINEKWGILWKMRGYGRHELTREFENYGRNWKLYCRLGWPLTYFQRFIRDICCKHNEIWKLFFPFWRCQKTSHNQSFSS